MIDLVTLLLQAGNGGNGRVSFRREKYVPKGGPDGGIGGDGGDIRIIGDSSMATLKVYAGKAGYTAEGGQLGGDRNKTGQKGAGVELKVPLGTEIWVALENKEARKRRLRLGLDNFTKRGDITREKYFVEKEGQIPPPLPEPTWFTAQNNNPLTEPPTRLSGKIESFVDSEAEKILVATIIEEGQSLVICQGGFGGRGNTLFKGSSNTTPLEAEYGTFGEGRLVILELKLLADIGFVGFPNAGKSTLLSALTEATPKIANYPFTTIEPHLGTLDYKGEMQKVLVLADVPGLIEGASEGRGLGQDFLRHLENCQVLMYVLALDEETIYSTDLDDIEKAQTLLGQFKLLKKELVNHGRQLERKPFLVGVNKSDLYSESLTREIINAFASESMEVVLFSAFAHKNLDLLKEKLVKLSL